MKRFNPKLSLSKKISVIIFTVIFVFGGVAVIFTKNRMSSVLSEMKYKSINLLAIEQTHEIEKTMAAWKREVAVVAQMPEVISYLENDDRKEQDKTVLEILSSFGIGEEVASIYLFDTTGLVWVSTDPTFTGENFGFRDYFKRAVAGEEYDSMAIGSVSKLPGFYFSAPIKNRQGEIIGVAAVKINIEVISETLGRHGSLSESRYMLVNDDGVIIFSNKEGAVYKSLGKISEKTQKNIEGEKRYLDILITPLGYDKAQQRVESGAEGSFSYSFYDKADGDDEVINVNKVEGFPLYIVSEVLSGDIKKAVAGVVNVIILFIGGAIVASMIVLGIVFKKLFSPLFVLDNYAKKIAAGDYSEVLNIHTGDEMESLSKSVTEMVVSLRGLSADLEKRVLEKTAELEKSMNQVERKNIDLADSKKALLNVMEDLSKEKVSLANGKTRLETILSSIGDGVFVVDGKGKIESVNNAALRMSGFSEPETLGKYYTETMKFRLEDDPEKKYPDFVARVLETGEQQSLQNHTVILHKDGSGISVLDSASPVLDVDGKVSGCVVVFRDNTRERELEKSKDDFLSVAAHQLRTPLGSMRWNLEMLLGGDLGEIGQEVASTVEQINMSNSRMITLVNDLLNVSRIGQGRIKDEPKKTDIVQVIREAILEMEPLVVGKSVKISFKTKKKAVPKIMIDPKRFREVIQNILSNAVKYNVQKGKVSIDLNIERKQAVIAVSDTGLGIPEEAMPKLFSKFFRADNAVLAQTEGSGLGLFVVKKFVESWGGKVEAKSKLGVGTTITITLPLSPASNILDKNLLVQPHQII